jgi:recombination protein RecT
MTTTSTAVQTAQPQQQITVKSLFGRDDVKKKFEEMLGKRASSFIASVLQIASSNDLLKNADPYSIMQSAAVAATLDLPLNNSLGFAYIVPYNVRQKDGSFKQMAQFQIGYKGFIQLAQRSGQFKTIGSAPIYEGQLIEQNPLTGFVFDFTKKKSDIVIGYAAYFSLINGFEKTLFMTVEELNKHGKRYSKTYDKSFSVWKNDFEAMANKTVVKLLLAKYAPLSVDMQKAVVTDQSIVNDANTMDVTYADAEIVPVNKELERMRLMIEDCTSVDDLEAISQDVPEELEFVYTTKLEALKNGKC